MDFIQNAILEQWEKATGIYAEAARLVRIDMEKEERDNPPSLIAHLSRADWDAIPIDQKWEGANKRQVRTQEGWVLVRVLEA